MAYNLKNRSLLTLGDFSGDDLRYLLKLAADLKSVKYAGTEQPLLKGKEIALIFEKDSTRTRVGLEVAAFDQGAHVTYLGPSGSHIGNRKPSRIPHACWGGSMTPSHIAASGNPSSKSWRNGPASRSTTG